MEAKEIVAKEVARQAKFGYEPSWEDFVIAGHKAGIRKVVETIDRLGLIEHTDSPLHETGATILDCPGCVWYAYKAKLKNGEYDDS